MFGGSADATRTPDNLSTEDTANRGISNMAGGETTNQCLLPIFSIEPPEFTRLEIPHNAAQIFTRLQKLAKPTGKLADLPSEMPLLATRSGCSVQVSARYRNADTTEAVPRARSVRHRTTAKVQATDTSTDSANIRSDNCDDEAILESEACEASDEDAAEEEV